MLKVGDKVRISLHKRHFEKGATANWSEEIFEIVEVLNHYKPVVYKLKDLADEEVGRKGRFWIGVKCYDNISSISHLSRVIILHYHCLEYTSSSFLSFSGDQKFSKTPGEGIKEVNKRSMQPTIGSFYLNPLNAPLRVHPERPPKNLQ